MVSVGWSSINQNLSRGCIWTIWHAKLISRLVTGGCRCTQTPGWAMAGVGWSSIFEKCLGDLTNQTIYSISKLLTGGRRCSWTPRSGPWMAMVEVGWSSFNLKLSGRCKEIVHTPHFTLILFRSLTVYGTNTWAHCGTPICDWNSFCGPECNPTKQNMGNVNTSFPRTKIIWEPHNLPYFCGDRNHVTQ